ncbi:hypothetical protein VTN77DRAFT_9720 [Rasamsonia byssochlamydoides]|uniref:uncharacterized protein n=1 Tax=Rasamsonia byssochlamydoides TaxID=89139 RepID=UPI003742F2CF
MATAAHPGDTSTKDPIDLFRGWPNPALLPVQFLSHASTIALSTPSIYEPGLQYGPDEGYGPLRQHVAEWLTSFYAPRDPISRDRICISGGASQNLACILQVFTDPAYTRNIWMVAPTYYLACRIFDDAGFAGRLRGIPEDAEGIDVDFLERGLQEAEERAVAQGNTKPSYKPPRPWRKVYKHVIYLTPTFANPSMKVVSLRRREQLVRLARRYDALIVTDDVYDFLQWPSLPEAVLPHPEKTCVPRLVDIDRYLDGGPIDEWGNTVSNGSFSKLIAPGVRTGWAEGTERFAYGLSQAGSSRSGGAPSQLAATFVDQLLSTGALQKHIATVLQPAYRARYQRVMTAIHDHLVPLGFSTPSSSLPVVGGYFIWVNLPQSLRASDLAQKALTEENLRIGSGTLFQVQGDPTESRDDFEGCIRISFAWEKFDLLDEGVQRLADVARRMLAAS